MPTLTSHEAIVAYLGDLYENAFVGHLTDPDLTTLVKQDGRWFENDCGDCREVSPEYVAESLAEDGYTVIFVGVPPLPW
ncbi:hypothetical protein [Leifsonia sp. Leaf264]|uniref:hypothetical protein n=1 Tax=Leifsonia sp. Leaf264 TaxID=1736314 RepID=UPI0006F50766|nr:hypothetical protein [Leifsonia sp. Leaf264]KQO98326.1 hypothetical protein ASF30_09710 [Leifsonia sp. Leaf264]